MKNLLAIDTATDALSLALQVDGTLVTHHRVLPRRHQQLLFSVIDELCDGRPLASLDLDAVVYGKGPGSFTGLRIAASAAQGLAYSLGIPAIGLSTLETQLRTYLRRHNSAVPAIYLSTIDARIDQLYAAVFHVDGTQLTALGDPVIIAAADLELPTEALSLGDLPVRVIGSGQAYRDAMPDDWASAPDEGMQVLPEAQDMLVPAAQRLDCGEVEQAGQVLPDYVQQKVGWKTLAEQGKSA